MANRLAAISIDLCWSSVWPRPLTTLGKRLKPDRSFRLRPGFTKAQAAAEIVPIFEQMRREQPSLQQVSVGLNGINDRLKRSLGKALYLILAAVVLLLPSWD
jgi:hypothetical protein